VLAVSPCAVAACAEELSGEVQVAAAVDAPTEEQVAGWIKNLDNPRYKEREEATQHLSDAGIVALDPLLAVANSGQPEPADRAVWILRRLGRSRENELSLAALSRLVQLQNRPAVVAKAEAELMERTLALCEQRLGPLGAEINRVLLPLNPLTPVPGIEVRLGERWHGKPEDLRAVAELDQQQYFRLEGAAINDDVVKLFAEKKKLGLLHLHNTKVTPAAIDLVKTRHPEATVYMRNQALLGVQAENHAQGVVVVMVQGGSAASNAGIVVGDVIAKIDGQKLPDFDRLTARIAQHQVGDKVDVEILRGEKTMPLKVELGAWASQE